MWPHEVEPWFHSWYRGRVETLDAKYNLAYIKSTLCGYTNSSKRATSILCFCETSGFIPATQSIIHISTNIIHDSLIVDGMHVGCPEINTRTELYIYPHLLVIS